MARTLLKAPVRTHTDPKPLTDAQIDRLTPRQLRAYIYRTDPPLAHIIDHEDGRWDPTIDYGGQHGHTDESYGLCQAAPGTKMRSAGYNWPTSAATQLRWCRTYAVSRYRSTERAWDFWERNRWW